MRCRKSGPLSSDACCGDEDAHGSAAAGQLVVKNRKLRVTRRLVQFLHSTSRMWSNIRRPAGSPSFQKATSISSAWNALRTLRAVTDTPGSELEEVDDEFLEGTSPRCRCRCAVAFSQQFGDSPPVDGRHDGLRPWALRLRISRTTSAKLAEAMRRRSCWREMISTGNRAWSSSARDGRPICSRRLQVDDEPEACTGVVGEAAKDLIYGPGH